MLYVLIPLVLLLALVLSVSLYAFLRGSTRRDRTELFRASTVAPSGRYKYRDRVQLGVDWYESQPKTEPTITSSNTTISGLTWQTNPSKSPSNSFLLSNSFLQHFSFLPTSIINNSHFHQVNPLYRYCQSPISYSSIPYNVRVRPL